MLLVFIVFSLIVVSLFIGTLRTPATAIVGVVCMFALEQWAQGSHAFFVGHRTFVNLTIGVLVVIGVVAKFLKKSSPMAKVPVAWWLVIILILYSLISVTWVTYTDISLGIWQERMPYIVVFIILAPLLVARIEDFQRMYLGVSMLGIVLIFLLLFTVDWNFRFIVLKGQVGEITLGNPLAPAEVAGNVACIILLYSLGTGKRLWLWLRYLAAMMCMLLIIKSGSRGELLSVFAALFIGMLFAGKSLGIGRISTVVVSVVIIAFATFWMLDEFLSGTLGADEANGWGGQAARQSRWQADVLSDTYLGRLQNVGRLLQFWVASPISIVFGLGNSESYNPNILGIYPHFLPGEVLGEEGLIGFGIYMSILWISARTMFSCYAIAKDHDVLRIHLAITVSLLIYSLFLSFKQGSFLLNMPFLMWTILLARYEQVVRFYINDINIAATTDIPVSYPNLLTRPRMHSRIPRALARKKLD